MTIDDIKIYRYEVGIIINNNRDTVCATNDLEIATLYYETTINKYIDKNDHVIVFLYDYDKHSNINFYDSQTELC